MIISKTIFLIVNSYTNNMFFIFKPNILLKTNSLHAADDDCYFNVVKVIRFILNLISLNDLCPKHIF